MRAGKENREERNGVIMEGGKRSREAFGGFFVLFFLWKHDRISGKVPLEGKTDDKRV